MRAGDIECEHITLVAREDGSYECIACDQKFVVTKVHPAWG